MSIEIKEGNETLKCNYLDIIKSDNYKNELDDMAKRIINKSRVSPNEATIESNFDCELFAFFRNNFSNFGFEYNPIKEKTLDTSRNILNGRADTAIATLIIEFKQPKTLNSDQQKNKAIKQITDYIIAMSNQEGKNFEGFITDGIIGCFLQYNDGKINIENFYQINGEILDRIIKNILQVKLVALNARNLVDGICNLPENNGVGFKLMHALFNVVENNIHPKTQMLFNEWMQLFNLAHDDISKQQAIINRKKSLEKLFGRKFIEIDDEYKALFSLQTSYAIIVKIIAFKVISYARYNTSLINFYNSMTLDSEALRMQMMDLENGAIFIQYGITNLLEGDFFSWYTNDEQWNTEIYNSLKEVFEKLSRYSDSSPTTSVDKAQDFFKELYQAMIPDAVRHSLGEYYTKKWLASCVINEALLSCSKNWKALDPCCGSGTFISILIEKVLEECKDKTNEEKLQQVLSRVKGIDLNPIAALTARVNYFINISHLVNEINTIEIPIYLGDASYVPKEIEYYGVNCLQYTILTLKSPIEVLIPRSMVKDTTVFSRTMNEVERYIKNLDEDSIFKLFCSICDSNDLNLHTKEQLLTLAKKLVDLERRKWNGIWARILANFLTTANMGKFDLIVGNPPWVDWKSLPSGYRDRIKSLCISKKLFSGDAVTGGINLNICALITNVVAQNWLDNNGIIAFLMPEPLIFQQSYEGFRKLLIDNDKKLYFYKFVNWEKTGHPFKPVTQKFLTYYIRNREVDYKCGVDVDYYIKQIPKSIDFCEEIDIDKTFKIEKGYLASCHADKNFFTYVQTKEEAMKFQQIAGKSSYIGREGIEFYPQELMVFHLSNLPGTATCTALDNMQNKKSKYKVPQRTVLLETSMLRPMVKGKDVTPFHVECGEYIVPFPYDKSNPKVPMSMDELITKAPRLAEYYQNNKKMIDEQTNYNERIIGRSNAEFYALARVGKYSYAENYVVFRDNSKWSAAVISNVETSWGGIKNPVFQNHAVSICEDTDGNFISYDEAHFICGVINTPIVAKYMLTSSDSRSFPIRPRIYIPKYNSENKLHKYIVELSKKAHKDYNNVKIIQELLNELNKTYMKILDEK